MVEFATLEDVDLTEYRSLRLSGVHGTLGLININADVFLCVISGAVRVAMVRPNETVQRILSVDFCQSVCLMLFLMLLKSADSTVTDLPKTA
jgi:hypothetical protein